MWGGSGTALLYLIPLLLLCRTCHIVNASCDLERIRVPGDLVLSTILGLRQPINSECGRYTPSEIQVAAAMVWAVSKLNGPPGAGSFIPNTTLGIDLSDDCSLERKAVQIGLNVLEGVGSPDVSTCSSDACHKDTARVVGIIQTSTSQTTGRVAELFKGTNLPVIGTAATTAALGNRTRYPTFFRTVSSDVKQMKVLLETLKGLNWTYIAVVYTTDTYGREGLDLLRKFTSMDEKVCIMAELPISPQETRTDVARDILASMATSLSRTRHDQLGVVYIGQLSQAELLIRIQHLGAGVTGSFRDFQRLYWVMSEAVGTNTQMIPKDQVGGLVTIALSSTEVAEFKTYFIDQLESALKGPPSTPMANLYRKYIEAFYACEIGGTGEKRCQGQDRASLENSFQQADYVSSAIDAVYLLASAVKRQFCLDGPMCSRTSVDDVYNWQLTKDIQDNTLDYMRFDAKFVPYEFKVLQRTIGFDNSGEVIAVNSAASYVIYNAWARVHTKVGEYRDDKLTLHTDSIIMRDPSTHLQLSGSSLPRSTCRGTCSECTPVEDIPFSYIPGQRIIVGLFSLSQKRDNSFKCGSFRTNTVSYLTFEAFNYAISAIQGEYPNLNFGGLAFDDCYSPLRAEYILSNFLSGEYKLTDSRTNTVIDPDKVVLVVGPLSSDVTLEVADMLTRLRIPQISYGASSPDLDNREKYPYFLRTVPSDVSQAKAIINILEEMDWKYVAAIHIDNNYGSKGMRTFKEMANKRGICVTDPVIPLSSSITRNDFENVVSLLRRTYSRVVVFFAIDTLAQKLLDGLLEYAKDGEFVFVATEAWGKNEQLLKDGRQYYANGAIVLHYDTTAPALSKRFNEYMQTKNPYTCRKCNWLKLFWQDHFKCDLEDSYIGTGRDTVLCNQRDHGDFDPNRQEQRVIHTIYAVQAGAKGLHSVLHAICKGKDCSTDLRQMTNGAEMLVNNISQVSLAPSPNSGTIFDRNGNGNVGFQLLNIQHIPSLKEHQYNPVGHYSDKEFVLNKEKLVFYDEFRHPHGYEHVQTKCELQQCGICENQTATSKPTVPPTTAAPLQTAEPESYHGVFIAMTLLAVVAIVALVGLIAWFCCCYRRGITLSCCIVKRESTAAIGSPQCQEVGQSNPSFHSSRSNISRSQLSGNVDEEPVYCEVNSTSGRLRLDKGLVGIPGSSKGSLKSSVQGSASGSGAVSAAGSTAGSSGQASVQFLRQQCICSSPELLAYIDTTAGRVMVCGQCSGIVTAPLMVGMDISNV